uniref:Uncharacterized protein n=1 Tax=Amphimedon queenslandica TaxID=400682 RepID=A0A1X7TJN7_AMPQE
MDANILTKSMFSLPRPERYEMPTSYYDDEILTEVASGPWPEMLEMATSYYDDKLLTDEPEIQVTSVRETALGTGVTDAPTIC